MNTSINFPEISALFRAAREDGRGFLYEYEVYDLLSLSGAETPPKTILVPRNAKPSEDEMMALPGEKIVLKIVSPTIMHKTELGGVRIIPKTPDKIRSSLRRMLAEIPDTYAALIASNAETAPEEYKDLSGEVLKTAIRRDLKGVLLAQFMPPDSNAFGNELIVGLRNTREFGPIISAGLAAPTPNSMPPGSVKGRPLSPPRAKWSTANNSLKFSAKPSPTASWPA